MNKHRGEVGIKNGETEIVLRPSIEAIIEWEEETGRSTLSLAVSGSERTLKITEVRAIIRNASIAAGNPITAERFKEIVESKGVAYLLGPAIALVSNALTGGTEAEPGEEPAAGQP